MGIRKDGGEKNAPARFEGSVFVHAGATAAPGSREDQRLLSSLTKGFSFVRNSMRSGVPARSNFSRKKPSR